MARRGWWGLGLFAASLGLVAACGSFGTDDDPATPADASTPPPSTSDAAVDDAKVVAPPTSDADADPCSTCSPTAACEDRACVEVAKALEGLRVESACMPPSTGNLCNRFASGEVSNQAFLTGTPGRSYSITLRFRGVVERRAYDTVTSGGATGTNAAFFVTVPAFPTIGNAVLGFEVGSTTKTHFVLNSGTDDINHTYAIDYTAQIRAASGDQVTLFYDNAIAQVRNRDQTLKPIVVPGIPPAPDAFDGQFVHVNVVSVAP